MLPHFGEYIVLKLDPVASLKHLDDPEVTEACEALESKSYVACVINLLSFPLPGVEYINIAVTLVSQGLPNSDLDRFILPEMSAPILPNTSHPLLRPPMKPSNPLPWSGCYHPTQAMTRCRIRNDTNIGDSWPEPKYKLNVPDRLRLSQQYFNEDADRRTALQREKTPASVPDGVEDDASLGQPDERQASAVNSPPPLAQETESHSIWGVDTKSLQSAAEVENRHFGEANGAQRKGSLNVSSFLRSAFEKVLPCIPRLRTGLYDDDDNVSTLSFDPAVALSMFSRPSTDLSPVIVVSNHLESVQQINDPWDFFRELEALKKIEAEYHERINAKIQNDIGRTRQKDEELHVRLQSKLPKALPEAVVVPASSAADAMPCSDA
ncbi:uncharacterized protein EV420DRAFT_1636672 [Desarmillaria tabescens]|uniref:Uncharacterized protein n=1 Tax=Armillaria tabescens TaxID=1929756 RepID=A0AA39NI59_ARMTA|nr:uncharacterized protein EV420DRAFT_1636672 [Desarmillaria tabescens]KAK0466067.1 hypothetical protein EV420DRAFT_1636672 [Desarmillaria tabescens]